MYRPRGVLRVYLFSHQQEDEEEDGVKTVTSTLMGAAIKKPVLAKKKAAANVRQCARIDFVIIHYLNHGGGALEMCFRNGATRGAERAPTASLYSNYVYFFSRWIHNTVMCRCPESREDMS